MRKIHLVPFLFALVFFASCKKDAQVKEPTAPKTQIATTELFYKGELDYDNAIAQIVGEKMRMVIPIKNNDGHKSFRYKISEFIKDGDPARSGFIVSLKEITKETNLFEIPINSRGSSFSNSKENSLFKNEQGRIIAKTKSGKGDMVSPGGEVLNLYAGCSDLPQLCVDWYYVSYDPVTGNTVSENYMYTTCYDPCGFNSNPSGGGSDGSGENCVNAVNSLKGGPTSEYISIADESEDLAAKERTRIYTWTFFKQNFGMWSYKSIERGVHKQDASGTWKWKSLEHVSVARTGWTLGGNLSCTVHAANPTVGVYVAGMELYYTVEGSAICKGSPLTVDHTHNTGSPIWNVNQSPPVE